MTKTKERRKYTVDELDSMREHILTTLGHYDFARGMQYNFSPDGECTGGGGCGASWGAGEKSPEEKRKERAEELLRTHMANGTDPADLKKAADAYKLNAEIEDAQSVVWQRRHKMLPEPNDCQYIKLLKKHGKYAPDRRDPDAVVENARALKEKEDKEREALKKLRSCGHVNETFIEPTDECGYCEHGLMPGIVVEDRGRPSRCNNCNRMTDGKMVFLPDWIGRHDSAEEIMESLNHSSHRIGWCLSCAKKRVSRPIFDRSVAFSGNNEQEAGSLTISTVLIIVASLAVFAFIMASA